MDVAHTSPTHNWDGQFYPDGIRSGMVKVNARPEGGISLDENFFVEF